MFDSHNRICKSQALVEQMQHLLWRTHTRVMITPAPTQRVTFAFQLCGDEHNMFPLWLNNTDSKHRQFGSGNALQRVLWKKKAAYLIVK